MTELTVTAAQVGAVDPIKAEIKSYIAAEALTKGDPVYILTAGTVGKADANAAEPAPQFRGIALQTVGAGQAVDVLHDGEVYGFDLSGLDVGDATYLSDTVGKLDDAAGSVTVVTGRVSVMTDKNATKVLRVFTQWEADWV